MLFEICLDFTFPEFGLSQPGEVTLISLLVWKPGEPDKSMLTLTHWQSWKGIRAILCDKIGEDRCVSLYKRRLDGVLKGTDEIRVDAFIKIIDRGYNKSILLCATA